MIKVVLYSRVSTEEEKQLNALEKQIQELTDYIHSQNNWVLVDKYIDEGISGTTSKGRHEYNRLYNDLLTDKFEIVVIKDQSRLMRNVLDWYLFLDRVMKNGKKIYMYLDNSFYTPDNAFISGIKAMMAEEYSRDLSKKIRSAAKRSQKNGTVYGNNRMLGYKQENGKLTIIEEEAEIVRQVFEWYIQGDGFRIIQNKLSEKGITSTTGTPFSKSTLRRMIKQEKYKGLLVSGKQCKNFETKQLESVPESEWVVIPNGVPAIVSEEVWEKANQCLKERSHISGADKLTGVFQSDTYPLSGKIFCGKCGKLYWHNHYVTKVNHQVRDQWICSTYKSYGIKACKNQNLFDSFLIDAVKTVLFNTYDNKSAVQETMEIIKQTLKQTEPTNPNYLLDKNIKLEKRRDKLLEMLLDEVITKEEYTKKKNDIEEQINNNIKEYEEQSKQIQNKFSINDRLKTIEDFLAADFKSPDDIDDETIRNIVDKIIVNDNQIQILLKNGESTVVKDIKKCNINSVSQCVTETGPYRTHTEILYQQRFRRTKNLSPKNWTYFSVLL